MALRTLWCVLLSVLFSVESFASDFSLSSPAFKHNQTIPRLYSCNGENIAPELDWRNPPPQTRSFVLIFYSPHTPMGINYLWVLYNLPPTVNHLPMGPELLPEGTMVGNNTYGNANYDGPCPPDNGRHHYEFTLYALDTMLNILPEADFEQIQEAMKYHILDKASLVGFFQH